MALPRRIRRLALVATLSLIAADFFADCAEAASASPSSASLSPDPDPGAQSGRRRGRGRGGRRGRRLRGANAPVTNAPAAKPAPPNTAPPGGALAKEEDRFRELMEALQREIDARGAEFATDEVPEAFADLQPGSERWFELERPIFEACDRDGNGWLSYREVRDALETDRTEFALYDRDRDGRIGSREFIVRYEQLVTEGGAFRLPKRAEAGAAARPRTATQLVTAFDQDGDRVLAAAELRAVLDDYGRSALDADATLAQLDADGSGSLSGIEIDDLSRFISAVSATGEDRERRRASLEDLFGEVSPRDSALEDATLPPRIVGPVTHFRRLDVDANGFITREDLRRLQGSAALDVRAGAVLAALDFNEDGRVSQAEFLNSLRARPQ
jgi:Ca2+-binding EF-hand superfamily protein